MKEEDFDLLTRAKIAVMFHGTNSDPDRDYTHGSIVSNYKYCKSLIIELIEHIEHLEKKDIGFRNNIEGEGCRHKGC